MCGIAGFWDQSASGARPPEAIGHAMSEALVHRGPDAGGSWRDPEIALVLAHRRLSILDLSPEGAQPMTSPSGRYVLVYNGEIYNHGELRRRLEAAGEAPGWRGHSDTETLLAAIEAWGLPDALEAAAGMFALALWDRKTRRLHLARDKMGEKPLYYGEAAGGLVFASELKAIRAVANVDLALDPRALEAYLSYGYVPETHAIYAGLSKVPPGAVLCFDAPQAVGGLVVAGTFLLDAIQAGAPSREETTLSSTTSSEMETILREVVASQMISDVPLGSFLSGGIDSSLVTALMQSVSDKKVRSFSIGFDEAIFDESSHAAAVARHLGTDHTEIRLTEADALALIPELPRIYDEPFADSSQIPTALLCRHARKAVTVALTGDGGDEVFGGYNRYLFAPRALSHARRLPAPLRRRLGPLARLLHRLGGANNPLLRRAIRRAGLPVSSLEKIVRLGEALGGSEDLETLYQTLTRIGPGQKLLRPDLRSAAAEPDQAEAFAGLAPAEWMMAMDSLTYLPGDILVKVDRAAMAASLETRTPFLDRRVVAAAWALPLTARLDEGQGKRILREILYQHVPRDLIERPKQGFAIPLDSWLRGELRGWAETLLAEDRVRAIGLLDADAVRELWTAHVSGARNEGQALWTVLMLMAWIEAHGGAGQAACPRMA